MTNLVDSTLVNKDVLKVGLISEATSDLVASAYVCEHPSNERHHKGDSVSASTPLLELPQPPQTGCLYGTHDKRGCGPIFSILQLMLLHPLLESLAILQQMSQIILMFCKQDYPVMVGQRSCLLQC